MNADPIDLLVEQLLSQSWTHLYRAHQRQFSTLAGGRYPGVYILAYSATDFDGQPIRPEDIFYVGMSNSDGGVIERLNSFITAITTNRPKTHSAGRRFFSQYAYGRPYTCEMPADGRHFYVASLSLECIVEKSRRTADDLRKMGSIASLEYYVLARCLLACGVEPSLNKQ